MSLSLTGHRDLDASWLKISHYRVFVTMARSVEELSRYVDLAELEETVRSRHLGRGIP